LPRASQPWTRKMSFARSIPTVVIFIADPPSLWLVMVERTIVAHRGRCPGEERSIPSVKACETSPEVSPDPVFGWLNFSSADNAGVHFGSAFMGAFSVASVLFIARRERSPCSQCGWRRQSDAAADPFLTDRGCSGFRARFAPGRGRERPHVTP